MFEFLFNYRPELFAEGRLTLLASPLRVALVVIALAITIWVLTRYWRSASVSENARPALLLTVRGLGLSVLAFALLQPALTLRAIKPQESFVAVLADNSTSMTIADTENLDRPAATRAAWLEQGLLGNAADTRGSGEVGPLWQSLADRFQVRTYSFDDQATRVSGNDQLDFAGRSSNLGAALETVRAELTGVPLAGVVLLTDGAIQTSDQLSDEVLRYRSEGIPVFPVAVGSRRFTRDLEISDVRVDRRALLGSTVEAELLISYPGFAGETVTVEVRDGGRVLQQEEIELPVAGDESYSFKSSFRTGDPGTRSLEFRVRGPAEETVAENNARSVLVEVEEGPHKILYFEGEPRFEYKFIRRAVADDEQLQLVSLLRMADNRFYRQSVDDEEELLSGFPTRREDLFQYRGLVLGSIEASFFTYEQMRMIVDFAAERGGGVLFVGGARALGEGGYANTPLAELVPVELSDLREVGPRGVSVRVRPTQLGITHAALQLGPAGAGEGEAFWSELPELLLLNRTGQLKAGAAALLTGRSESLGEDRLVLAHQRFGAGSSMLFTPSDSFRWQMRRELDDQTHELLWRQLLRWLINGVGDRVKAETSSDMVEPGSSVELLARVKDGRFVDDSNAVVQARVTAPSGEPAAVDLAWDQQQDGVYRASFDATEPGRYQVRVSALGSELGRPNEPRAEDQISFEVTALSDEFFGATRQVDLLEHLAKESGGKTFEANQWDALLDELSYSTAGVTVREDRPLWNMPILFFLMLLALLGEWSLRRWQGLR